MKVPEAVLRLRAFLHRVFSSRDAVYPTMCSARPSTSIISVRLTSFEIARFGGASNETVLLQLSTVV